MPKSIRRHRQFRDSDEWRDLSHRVPRSNCQEVWCGNNWRRSKPSGCCLDADYGAGPAGKDPVGGTHVLELTPKNILGRAPVPNAYTCFMNMGSCMRHSTTEEHEFVGSGPEHRRLTAQKDSAPKATTRAYLPSWCSSDPPLKSRIYKTALTSGASRHDVGSS